MVEEKYNDFRDLEVWKRCKDIRDSIGARETAEDIVNSSRMELRKAPGLIYRVDWSGVPAGIRELF